MNKKKKTFTSSGAGLEFSKNCLNDLKFTLNNKYKTNIKCTNF